MRSRSIAIEVIRNIMISGKTPIIGAPMRSNVSGWLSKMYLKRASRAGATRKTIASSEDGPFRANLVGSQIVGLVMTRYVVQIEPLAAMSPKTVAAAIAPTLQRYLLEPLSPDDP